MALAGIAGLALVLNLSNIGFPLGFHADEGTKIEFVTTGTQDFHHPLLMLQLLEAARLVRQPATPQELVVLGRMLMALAGVASVLLTFVLARQRLSLVWALGVALAVAVSPTLVVHAHYFDERTLLTTFLLAAALAFFRFVDRPTPAATVWLGMATGLAWSSHFEAVLLVPLALLTPWLRSERLPEQFMSRLVAAGVIATGVFVAVNWPLLTDFGAFLDGLLNDMEHVAAGDDDVLVHGHYYWFGFHLVKSLAAGMTWPALAVALGGTVAGAVAWRHADVRDRWILAAVAVFYLAVEIPPLKPWPDYSGYAIPVVPLLIYLGARGFAPLLAAVPSTAVRAVAGAAIVSAVIVYPLYDSTRLVAGLTRDTRLRAAAWLRTQPGKVVIGKYARITDEGRSVAELDADEYLRRGVEYVVASSFMYDRFRVGSRLPGQDADVYRVQARYEELFAQPFVEIAPAHRSFAFTNPTIRIVDLRPPEVRAAQPMPPVR